ncbi:MAG TPA: serine/threonine-protein kinase [Actinocrinis sp.]|jgi:hypothetical protein
MEPLSGDDPAHVADYQVRARLGAGGMGRVYLAYTPGGRPVALKVVRPGFGADTDFRERFRHEVSAARRVHGLYTAQVLDADPDADPPWLVTAYVPGPSLQQLVAQHGPLPPDTVFQLMAGVAEALGAIHAAGVVHRDLKPSNVILAPDGPRVIDFGIARAADAASITLEGTRVGSPQYMAPEQILDRPPAPAVDVFALGLLAAYAVLGHSPFGTGLAAEVFAHILNQPPDLEGCPEPLRTLIERCLSKDPDARPTPADVLTACREHRTPQTVQAVDAWLPPAMAAAVAQHAAPPPPTGPHPADRTLRTAAGLYLPRRTMLRAGAVIAVIGTAAGLGIVFLDGANATGTATPSHPSSATAAAASRSRPLGSVSASPSPLPGVDPCVIGTWRTVIDIATTTIDGAPTQFTGPGPTTTYRPDGTGFTDFGSGVTLRADVDGVSWTEVRAGIDTYDYQASNGSLQFSDVQASGTETLYRDGVKNSSIPLSHKASFTYTCSADTMTYRTQTSSSTVLTRTG